jgi:ubiquinone/menaquinone biosynthesis C-methylase UbiE
MRIVDYDAVAPAYDRRYEVQRFGELDATARQFLMAATPPDVVEVGCGTGHWLALVEPNAHSCVGIDPSREMLVRAQATAPRALLIRGRGEQLPLATASADRMLCINALHHFGDHLQFSREARRVLRTGGAVLIVGLDPHTETDQWWIYDYFPSAREADRRRYPAASEIRRLLAAAGFVNTTTVVAQHIPAAMPFSDAVERGLLDRRSTSQLLVIDDAEYANGMARLRSEQPMLTADLRLYATVARLE